VTGFVLPDVLVLGAGGVLGEAWLSGVLAGIEDGAGVDLRSVESLVGTSAGSIVAARLAGGERPRRPSDAGSPDGPSLMAGDPLPRSRRRRMAARVAQAAELVTEPLAPLALAVGTGAGARVRSVALSRIPEGTETLDRLHASLERLGTRFDGRLRVCCVDRRSGRRIVFGAPRAPRADVSDAVVASCAIPSVFAPVQIGGRPYVDGGVWSLTNLDAAPARAATEVLCLSPTASLGLTVTSPLGALRAVARGAIELEALALRRRRASVRIVGPDLDSARRMGTNLMAPERARDVLAAGYRQGLALAC
jgi:NTE family protein